MATSTAKKKTTKEETYVNNLIKIFDKKLAAQVKAIHVPVFNTLQKNINIESFFLNHIDFEAIMGNNVKLLDRMVMHIICEFVAERIVDDIKNEYFIGVWDKYTVYNVAAAVITFMKNSETTELYLTDHQFAQIDPVDLEKLEPLSYMPFSMYNPTVFVKMISRIIVKVTATMSNIMVEGIPNALISPDGKSTGVTSYIYARFWNALNKAEIEFPVTESDPTTEKNIMKFSDAIEEPIMKYIASELSNAGLSDNIINLFLGVSNLHIVYEVPENEKIGDVVYEFRLESKDDRFDKIMASVSLVAKDIMLSKNKESLADVPKTRVNKIGAELRKMINNFTSAAVSVYVSTVAANAENKN